VKKPLIEWQAIFPALFLIAACGQEGAETVPTAEEPAAKMEMEPARAPAAMARTPSIDGAQVFFIMPADGEVVSNPIRLEFGLKGMEVLPAGDQHPGSGHHHLIIDAGLPAFGLPVPADEHHVHFGDGSSQTELTLPTGQHTLQLLLADYLHVPHDPPVFSKRITITVE